MMEMTHLGDALVGDLAAGYGISVEERKRLTIGMELVAKPRILFLDGMVLAIFHFSFSIFPFSFFLFPFSFSLPPFRLFLYIKKSSFL
jgi:hypothetical protein